jgi:hypothetical protein
MTGFLNALGVGGSAAKTDRKEQLQGYGDLNNLFNFGFSSGKAETGQAQDLLGQAGAYQSKLLSGDRAATLSAVAPTVNAANATTDAAKRSLSASGTARGGGVNAVGQSLNTQKRANIDTAVNTAKAGAASGATATGGTMAAQAGQLLGVGTSSAESLTADASNSRSTSAQLTAAKQAAIDQVLAATGAAIFG